MFRRQKFRHMMINRHLLQLIAFVTTSVALVAPTLAQGHADMNEQSLTLWYDKPAKTAMTEALPIGNGRLGGLVFGDPEHERIALNEDSLWTGDANPSGEDETMGSYQALGDLLLTTSTPAAAQAITNYRRELNIANATTTVTYSRDGITFRREAFASHPDEIIALRWTASKPAALTATIALVDGHGTTSTADGTTIGFSGILSNGLKYATEAKVVATGGKLTAAGGKLIAENCDSIVILVAAATNYAMDGASGYRNAVVPSELVSDRLRRATSKGYDALRAAQQRDYSSLFDRVQLNVGQSTAAQRLMPSNLRKVAAAETFDPEMEALLFQYGRYLLISCSRPGGLPANLQGLWNDSNTPKWHSDYHANINVEMNYWPAEVTNLSECSIPFSDLVRSQLDDWRAATKASPDLKTPEGGMSTRGFAIRTSHNTMGGMGWHWDKTANAWYCQVLWEHYAFGGDVQYLKETAFPIMREVVQFWQDHLKTLPDGSLVVPDGWSPEHGPTEDGVSYNQQIVWDLFNHYVEACTVLGSLAPPEDAKKIAALRNRLAGPRIGRWGQLQEWMTDRDLQTDPHRHTSHLFALYPGNQISVQRTPELAKAAKLSLDARGIAPESDVREWSFAWRAALYARLGDGQSAHQMVQQLFTDRNTCLNLFGLHPPMQIDGNFGVTAAIAEMLLQSQDGEINLLPALPSDWSHGSVRGLRARGGFVVDLVWNDHQLAEVTVRGLAGAQFRVRCGNHSLDTTLDGNGQRRWDGPLQKSPPSAGAAWPTTGATQVSAAASQRNSLIASTSKTNRSSR